MDQDSTEQPLLLTPLQAARSLNCGRTTIFNLIRQGELDAVKVGRLTRVPYSEVTSFVERRIEARREHRIAMLHAWEYVQSRRRGAR